VIGDHAEIGDLTAIAGRPCRRGRNLGRHARRKIGTVDVAALPPQAEASPAGAR
jgi:hypothetical protein